MQVCRLESSDDVHNLLWETQAAMLADASEQVQRAQLETLCVDNAEAM